VALDWRILASESCMNPMLEAVHPVLTTQAIATSVRFFQQLGFALIFQDEPPDQSKDGT
jgi:hypothetical protein